jgi:site-specific recombinase XerD
MLMQVVYLFHGEGEIAVPFYDYDAEMFSRLRRSGSAFWDRRNSRFVLSARPSEAEFNRIFSDVVSVEVGRNQALEIRGFFDRERRYQGMPDETAAESMPESDAECFSCAIKAPDQFAPVWKEKLETELHARKYSRATMQSYVYYNRAFCRLIQKTPEEVKEADIKAYLAYMDKAHGMSSSAMNLAISALKFFYGDVLKKDITNEQSRPRHDKRLPGVLSRSEIQRLLDGEKNPKHRLLLMLTYSSGLRVSEVVVIKKDQIDFDRKTILVKAGKGRRDRYTLLSDRAAAFVKEYCALFDVDSWLFPGQPARRHLSIRSAQNIFEKSLKKAQIAKTVSIHSLRHTFATHLLEGGTDIRYIQSLLGHATLRTTERYTHIARRNVLRIQSPLDSTELD